MMEQVLINFITNATHAVKDKPEARIILFSGITIENEPYLTVADNGIGIGLSLSREIVKLHNGRLQIQSQVGEGSAFTVLFTE